jgi:hypothetical protein
MKALLAAGLVLMSLGAAAKVELVARNLKSVCKITDNKVSLSQTFGKEDKLGFSESWNISTSGLESVISIVERTATTRPQGDDEISFDMIKDGKTFAVIADDAPESINLIRFMVRACHF